MFTFANLSRCAGTLCLIGTGVLASVLPALAEETEPAACDAAWHAAAEQRANQGLQLEQGYGFDNLITLWRRLSLGEGEPDPIAKNESALYQSGPFLPMHFPDDPEVTRILGLIEERRLADAITAIEALTHIPDPAETDIASERLLVRSELLFAGVLWAAYWDDGAGTRALKWIALLDAHFLSLPVSTLNHDIAVNGAYWRAIDDLEWFLRPDGGRAGLQGQEIEDWWLPNTRASLGVAAGVGEAMQESPLLEWLYAMQASGSRFWIAYLTRRFGDPAYANVYDHLMPMADRTGALPWQIAAARWWAPALGWRWSAPLNALEERAKTCTLTPAEQYALGILRFHDARIRALKRQKPDGGYLGWSDEIEPAEAATANDPMREEIARFALMVGQPGIAQEFQAARNPKADGDSTSGSSLAALTAPDLARFAAANPDPSALNLLPVRILAELVEMPGLRPDLRAAVARMAWTRAYLLDDTAVLDRVTPLVVQTNAGLKPLLDDYQAAWTDAGRRKAAMTLLLQAPGMLLVLPDAEDLVWEVRRTHIWSESPKDWNAALFMSDHLNPNDNNWWCRFDIDRQLVKLKQNFYDEPLGLYERRAWQVQERMTYSVWIRDKLAEYRDQVLREHAILKQIDYEELGRLAKVPNAPVYLAQTATDWTRSSWWWDRFFQEEEMSDALAASIRATRWGCHRDGSNGAVSHAAWRALHDLFPDSEAAKNSPYWYN